MKLAQNAILLSRLIQDQENASLVKICSVRTFFLNCKHIMPMKGTGDQSGSSHKYLFLEHAGELRIFVLREEKSPITFPSPYLGLE